MKFNIIENTPIIEDYSAFKTDFLNPRMTVDTIRKKYDLSVRKYRTLREQVYSETGLQRKPYLTMRNQTTTIINNNTYIHKYKKDKYLIQKKIDGKRKSFGVYKDLTTARYVRNKLIECNWNNRVAEELRKEYSVTHKTLREQADEKYSDFKRLYNQGESMQVIQDTLNLTRYQYIHLSQKRKEEEVNMNV